MQVRLLRPVKDPSGETDEEIPAGTVLTVLDMTVETLDQAVSFGVQAEEVEPLPPSFADLGFEDWELDGGGHAYGLELADGRYLLATDAGGTKLPSAGDGVLVGIYGDDDVEPEIIAYPYESALRAIGEIIASVPV